MFEDNIKFEKIRQQNKIKVEIDKDLGKIKYPLKYLYLH